MKTIFKICFALLTPLVVLSCSEKDNVSEPLEGVYMITAGDSKAAVIDDLLRFVGFESEQITVFYELNHKPKSPEGNGGLDADISIDNGGTDRVDQVSYFVSIDESDNGLQFVLDDKKVITDLFAGSGNLETFRLEEHSAAKIVLLGRNNTTIYTLTKVNNVKRIASLKNGVKADLDEIRQNAEIQD